MGANQGGRNLRSVWTIPTEAYAGAHFATFPRKLVEPCVKAGTSEKGCCPVCGKAWERVTEREPGFIARIDAIGRRTGKALNADYRGIGCLRSETTGWRPTCPHADTTPVPCRVLDPFAGSGATGVVSLALGRQFIGLDLSREYLGMALRRISRPHAPVVRVGRTESYPLFDAADTREHQGEDDEPDDQQSMFRDEPGAAMFDAIGEADEEDALSALPGM